MRLHAFRTNTLCSSHSDVSCTLLTCDVRQRCLLHQKSPRTEGDSFFSTSVYFVVKYLTTLSKSLKIFDLISLKAFVYLWLFPKVTVSRKLMFPLPRCSRYSSSLSSSYLLLTTSSFVVRQRVSFIALVWLRYKYQFSDLIKNC